VRFNLTTAASASVAKKCVNAGDQLMKRLSCPLYVESQPRFGQGSPRPTAKAVFPHLSRGEWRSRLAG